jgi:ornithine decarboxylase
MAAVFNDDDLRALRLDTPFFCFSKTKMRETYEEFVRCFPGAVVHYAMKADAEPGVLAVLKDAGSSFEVASVFELHLLQQLNITADAILYGSSVKPSSHIETFCEYGVDRFAFDSLSELEKIVTICPKARVYVRMNVDDAGSIYCFSEKFGAAPDAVAPLLIRAKELGAHPYGVSFHVGSQASNPSAWGRGVASLAPVLADLEKSGIRLDVINIGGGFPCNYASPPWEIPLRQVADSVYAEYDRLPYRPRLVVEPGRAIVADSAVLVASVIARVDREEHTWLFLDAGVYNGLFESLAYQGAIRYRVTSLAPERETETAVFALAGPTGDSWDVITREARLPRDMKDGDRLVFHAVGAYNLVMVGRFNGFAKPIVHFV